MNPSSQSDNFSFELNHSLMERFIALRLDEIKKRFTELLNKKALDSSDETEIRNATYLVFSILGKEIGKNDVDKNPDLERFVGVPIIFNDIVRLAVAQENPITTYTKYKTCISSPDAALQYFLYKLGYLKFESEKAQLNGEYSKTNDNKEFLDITFGNVEHFINRRIRRLYQINPKEDNVITQIVTQLKDDRNSESHNAFYTSPEKYWERLINLIYAYIAIAFFLTRYFKRPQNQNAQVRGEDYDALNTARKKINDIVTEAKKIHVRFQFEKKDEAQKLSITVGNKPIGSIGRAPETLTENGITYCYYDTILERNTTYTLQSIVSKNIYGNLLSLNTDILFDGAVVLLEMPTKENSIRCPEIKTIIANSTGLIEDSEHRAVIEKLLARNIGDDSLRSKLRVILMLDKGEKEKIINELINQNHNIDNLSDEDFKKFIESKSNDILKTIDRHFESLNNSLKNGQDELKGFIANAISQIDLRSILDSNAKLGDEVRNLASEITKWQEIQEKIGKRNADEARKMYDCLKDNAEKSNQTIADLSQIIKSQNGYWNEVLSKLTAIAKDVTTILTNQKKEAEKAKKKQRIRRIIIVSTAILCLIILALGSWSCYHLRTSSNALVAHSKWRSEIAHNTFGNKDVAYERATYLESIKDYPEAAKWYMMARNRYADILKDNPADSVRALRMAQMLMRGKGGIIDTKGAEAYAKMAKRFDIEAYLAVLNGNPFKTLEIVNNFQGVSTSYLELADALGRLRYPHIIPNPYKTTQYWNRIDSLAFTDHIATEEALMVASSICNTGLIDKDGNYLRIPSIYDAIAYAADADTLFNSLNAQLFLAAKYETMGAMEYADKYNKKANDNGRKGDGEITFSHSRINELDNDPQALIARANNNAKKGNTDYRMTAYYYHLSDSLNRIVNKYVNGPVFYQNWVNFVVSANDLASSEHLLPLINKEYPDSIRSAIADYIMAMKSIDKDSITQKAYNYLLSASSKGLIDAQAAIGILWDMQDKPDGMRILNRLTSQDKDNVHPWAARYILSKWLNNNRLNFSLLRKLNNDEFALSIKLSRMASVNDLLKFDKATLMSLKAQIEIILSQQSDLTQFSYFFGKLAEIEYILDRPVAANFYIGVINNLSPRIAYTSILGISEIARNKGDLTKAAFFAGRFAKLFFMANGGVLDENNRINVIQHFQTLYPEILERVNKETNHDFRKGIFFLEESDFNLERDFKAYVSPIENLHIDLPNYERFAFPVTMKYFE